MHKKLEIDVASVLTKAKVLNLCTSQQYVIFNFKEALLVAPVKSSATKFDYNEVGLSVMYAMVHEYICQPYLYVFAAIYIMVSQCVGGSKGLTGYNYQAGSYTPVVTFDMVVISQQGKFKASQSIIKKMC